MIPSRVRDVAANRIAVDHGPCAPAIFELVDELHDAGPTLDVKIYLRLGVVSLDSDFLHVRVECLQIEVAGMVQMLLDRRSNLSFRLG